MDVNVINPFINATRQVMRMMAGIQTFEKSELDAELELKAKYDVSATIGLAGAARGTIVLSFSKDIAVELLSRLVGEKIEHFDKDACDAVGEMVNIIVGSASAELSEDIGNIIDRSIPSVVLGRGHRIFHPPDIPCINVVFNTEVGQFAMQVSFIRENGA